MNASNDTIIGIDLGTTNSLVAVADEAGPRIIRGDGEALLPSVVCYRLDGSVEALGASAQRHAVERPERTIYSVKRLMGRGTAQLRDEISQLAYRVMQRGDADSERDVASVAIGDHLLTPPQISAEILRALRDRATSVLGEDVRRAVVTVPAYFDDAQRQATRDAGTIAGLDVVRIVNEPTAAALAYGLDRRRNATIAVYDLGGGTFDITLLRIEDGVFEVLSTNGDTHLGGDDFDRTIIDLARREIAEQFEMDIQSPATRQALRTFAEQVKVRLSVQESADLEVDLGGERVYRRTITRSAFEAMIAPLVERTLDACRQALRDARLTPDAIDEVVLVGGSTRVPFVRQQVGRALDCRPYTALDPEQVVALGAALQGAILSGVTRDMLLLDVTPLSLGIETMGGAMGKLIMRNTKIPCRATETFTTFQDGQVNVKIHVLQGERELARDCRTLGEFTLTGIPPMPAGLPKIDVSFLIDQNGILNVTAKEQRSGAVAGIQVVPTHGLTESEVKQMTAESIQHARADMNAHRLIDLRNQVAFDTEKCEQMLARHGSKIDAALRGQISERMADLRRLADATEDTDRLAADLTAFDHLTVPLAEAAITANLQTSPSDQ